ncbi:MAG: ParA family protein [Verrucomicrobiia bacterium]
MTTICIGSQKGGVGKTTVSLNLAHSFAKRGWRTLLVDLDSQGAIAFSLSERARNSSGFHQVATAGVPLEASLLNTIVPTLKILTNGGAPALGGGAPAGGYDDGSVVATLLREADAIKFDLVLLDTPPGFSGITLGALKHADFLLAPQQAEPLAIRSVGRFLEALKELGEQTGRTPRAAILLTMLDPSQPESMQVTHELWGALPADLILETIVTRDPIFVEASARGLPVALLRSNPPAAALMFDQIAAELEARLSMAQSEHDQPIHDYLD